MSDTPRTDAYRGVGPIDSEAEDAFDFARTLERELAEAQEQLVDYKLLAANRSDEALILILERDKAREELAEAQHRIKEMQARIATLESDLATAEIEECAMKTRIAELELKAKRLAEIEAISANETCGELSVDECNDRTKMLMARIAALEANQCEEEPIAWRCSEGYLYQDKEDADMKPLYRKKKHE